MFTIVIPVYNTKLQYLERCIQSALNQIEPLEVIIVNDGSTTVDTLNYLHNLSKIKDHRIKIFNNSNNGVSFSRNMGIINATGDYIIFLDSDDFLANNCLTVIKEFIKDNEMLFFKNRIFINEENRMLEVLDSMEYTQIDNKNAIISEVINPRNITPNVNYGTPWAKLFKKDFLKQNKIFFDINLPRTQDRVFVFDCLSNAEKIGLLEYSGYIYNSNIDSICSKYNVDLFNKLNRVYNAMKERTNNTEFQYDVDMMYLNFFFEVLSSDIFHKENEINFLTRIKKAQNLYKQNYKTYISSLDNYSSLNHKRFIMLKMCEYHASVIFFIMFYFKCKKSE